MAMTAKLWTITGLAAELGRDRRTIAAALRDVPPDGKSRQWDAWFLTTALRALSGGSTGDNALDLAAERARLAAAQAAHMERKNAIQDGEFLETRAVHIMATTTLLIVRAKLLAIPPRLAPLVAPDMTPAAAQKILQKEIYATLDEMAATNLADYDHSNEFATRSIADLLHGEQETMRTAP